MTAGKIPPKGTPERSAYFAELVSKRKDRQEPRPAPRDGRVRMFSAGSAQESTWERTALDLGLSPDGTSRLKWRRLLYRLAQAEVRRVVDGSRAPVPSSISRNDALALTFDQTEILQLRERARRDRDLAAQHDREADEAEARLVARMRKLGLAP